MMKDQRKTGTREWSEYSVNICKGCSNGCLYCYARAEALRYKRIDDGEAWANEQILDEPAGARQAKNKKIPGRIMFPTTHDITPYNVEACTRLARSMIRAGNELLIVSKPSPECMAELLEGLLLESDDARSLVTLRYTITCLDNTASAFWEPNAPRPSDRWNALRAAFNDGWRTSVSMEPLLDATYAADIVRGLSPKVTGSIWVGTCRDLKKRTAWALSGTEPQFKRLAKDQTDAAVIGVYEQLKDNPKMRWKDSYVKVLQKKFGGTWVDGRRSDDD